MVFIGSPFSSLQCLVVVLVLMCMSAATRRSTMRRLPIQPSRFFNRVNHNPAERLAFKFRSGADLSSSNCHTNIYNSTNSSNNSNITSEYPGRLVMVQCEHYPGCEIYLCGTLHISNSSIDLVKQCISRLRPRYVVLELCEERLSTLEEPNPTIPDVTWKIIVTNLMQHRDWGKTSMDLLCWLQQKVGKLLGSKVGGEQYEACKEGHNVGASIILGDRKYSITMERMLERLGTLEKLKIGIMLVWEALTCSARQIGEYLRSSEADNSFVRDELDHLSKYFPSVSDVLINERDDYLARTISQVALNGFPNSSNQKEWYARSSHALPVQPTRCIVAVLGAAHLPGVEARLRQGGTSRERVQEISQSRMQPSSVWPRDDLLHAVNTTALYSCASH